MRIRAIAFFCLGLMLMLVACDQAEDNPPTATSAPPTPTQEQLVDTPVPAPTRTPFVRSTLPPTWTPTPSPEPTPEGEEPAGVDAEPEDGGAAPPPVVPATINPACGTLGPDREIFTDANFDLGESPRIAWTPVEDAALYRVIITSEAGFEVHNVLIEETVYDVNPDVFEREGPYGWDVIPLDAFGVQMCIGRGDMLLAQ